MANLQISFGLTIEKRLKIRYQKKSQIYKADSDESDFDISQTDEQPVEVETATQHFEQERDHVPEQPVEVESVTQNIVQEHDHVEKEPEQTQSLSTHDENEPNCKPGFSKNGIKLGRKPKVSKALKCDDPVAQKSTYERVLRNKNR